eukprot:gene3020-2002_t
MGSQVVQVSDFTRELVLCVAGSTFGCLYCWFNIASGLMLRVGLFVVGQLRSLHFMFINSHDNSSLVWCFRAFIVIVNLQEILLDKYFNFMFVVVLYTLIVILICFVALLILAISLIIKGWIVYGGVVAYVFVVYLCVVVLRLKLGGRGALWVDYGTCVLCAFSYFGLVVFCGQCIHGSLIGLRVAWGVKIAGIYASMMQCFGMNCRLFGHLVKNLFVTPDLNAVEFCTYLVAGKLCIPTLRLELVLLGFTRMCFTFVVCPTDGLRFVCCLCGVLIVYYHAFRGVVMHSLLIGHVFCLCRSGRYVLFRLEFNISRDLCCMCCGLIVFVLKISDGWFESAYLLMVMLPNYGMGLQRSHICLLDTCTIFVCLVEEVWMFNRFLLVLGFGVFGCCGMFVLTYGQCLVFVGVIYLYLVSSYCFADAMTRRASAMGLRVFWVYIVLSGVLVGFRCGLGGYGLVIVWQDLFCGWHLLFDIDCVAMFDWLVSFGVVDTAERCCFYFVILGIVCILCKWLSALMLLFGLLGFCIVLLMWILHNFLATGLHVAALIAVRLWFVLFAWVGLDTVLGRFNFLVADCSNFNFTGFAMLMLRYCCVVINSDVFYVTRDFGAAEDCFGGGTFVVCLFKQVLSDGLYLTCSFTYML